MTSAKKSSAVIVFYSGPKPLQNHTTWIDLLLAYYRTLGANHSTLSSSSSSLQDIPHLTVQLEVKGQGIVADDLILAG